MLSRPSSLLRPPPTPSRPPTTSRVTPVIDALASRRPQQRGRGGSPQFPGQPSDRSTPLTPEGPSTPAPDSQVSSMAFAVAEPARHPLDRLRRRWHLTTLAQASHTLRTGQSLRPAPHPASRPRTRASLPRTRASPRTGLPPAGSPELVARLRHDDLHAIKTPALLGALRESALLVRETGAC